MSSPVAIYKAAATQIITGGTSLVVIYGNTLGGIIWNPTTAEDQGLAVAEPLYVDVTGPATLSENRTTYLLSPGQFHFITSGQTTDTWVNAETSGHKFTAIVFQQPTQGVATPIIGEFPPSGPTSLLNTIPSYLYLEYEDDDDLRAFVIAYNQMTQEFVDWFNNINLPIYTQPQIAGGLLDWVGAGLYGMPRPTIASFQTDILGPYNTFEYNHRDMPYNGIVNVGPINVTATSDDTYRRILTWHLYKGDGKEFSIRWLKRRVIRFLLGVNGTDYEGPTYQISVTLGVGSQINITILAGLTTVIGGTMYNDAGYEYNSLENNAVLTSFVSFSPLPYTQIFKEAIDSGVLEMPLQSETVVVVQGAS